MRQPLQAGQSTIEYLLVLVALTGGLALAAQSDELASAVKEQFTDYSYAMAVSQIPDCVKSKDASAGPITVKVSADGCPDPDDWSSVIPKVSVSWSQD